ncbi:MAG: FtsW/RodA/SpoVE family cell cycle protein [Leptospiraceae bacterium]|nr:FtsW/RodA/SpoVE family cell cycle protein [Leptospiraceae bacterium]MDW7976581.1 FtsW/RodA/SpoVE family cell cycle protein [Leptospiraceae bacterium]
MERNLKFDFVFLVLIFLLSLLGLWYLYSSSSIIAYHKFNDAFYYSNKQTLWHVIGYVMLIITMLLDIHLIKKFYKLILYFSILLLGLVFFPGLGKSVSSDEFSFDFRRWIQIGNISIQPSEFVKIAFLLYLAVILEKYPLENFRDFKRNGVLFLPIGVIFVLLYFQPHYGTLILLFLTLIALLYISGFPFKKILIGFVVVLIFLGILAILQPYRYERILVWLNPYEYQYNKGYQLVMSFRAFKEGGLWGMDIHQGVAHRYLTFGHTDFIFSLISESHGVMGCLLLLFLYVLLLVRGVMLVKNISEPFRFYFSSGILLIFGLQVWINISVSTGLLPTTGIGLPFVSYGGSSLISYYIMMGLFLNLTNKEKEHGT